MALADSKARIRCTKLSSPSARLFRSSPNACECSTSTEDCGFGAVGFDDTYDVCAATNVVVGDGETVRDLRFRIVGRGKILKAVEFEGNGRDERPAAAVKFETGRVGELSIFTNRKFRVEGQDVD